MGHKTCDFIRAQPSTPVNFRRQTAARAAKPSQILPVVYRVPVAALTRSSLRPDARLEPEANASRPWYAARQDAGAPNPNNALVRGSDRIAFAPLRGTIVPEWTILKSVRSPPPQVQPNRDFLSKPDGREHYTTLARSEAIIVLAAVLTHQLYRRGEQLKGKLGRGIKYASEV
jgi:hypothetical protein